MLQFVRKDRDEKLFVLEPVVVLERIETIPKVQSRNVEYNNFHIPRNYSAKRKKQSKWKPLQNYTSKKVEKFTDKKSIHDERPHMCSLCGERFHTNILLGVHKRIHNAEDNSDDDSDNEPVDNNYDTTVAKNILHDGKQGNDPTITEIPVAEGSEMAQNEETYKDDNSTRSSVLSLSYIPHYTDHVYALTPVPTHLRKKPGKKTESTKAPKKEKKRHQFVVICNCKLCPVSFSRSWYLQLHMTLLHDSHQKDTFIECPGCSMHWYNEDDLRQHVENSHPLDLSIMNEEISTCLRVPTDALTGENKKFTKKRLPSQECPPELNPVTHGYPSLACNWRKATTAEKDEIMDVVETELRLAVLERNKLGDHFTYGDIQRLGMEIAGFHQVSDFLYGNPTKRWAQKILRSVGQRSRPGKYRFIHNANISYLNAVTNLSARGLSEHTIFYVFELSVCNVIGNQIVQKAKLPTGATSRGYAVSAIVSTNSTGAALLYPTFTYQGTIVHYKDIYKSGTPCADTPPKDFLETPYVNQWFDEFLGSIPKTRPVLLLIEGDVSQLPYSIIFTARESDVHLVFLPSRKRFVHPHLLIRKSLASPLSESFEKEIEKFLTCHNAKSVHLQYFGEIFDSAWDTVIKNADVSKSFQQSGFIPLPKTTGPLEEAARKYLNVAISSKSKLVGPVSSHTDPQSDDSTCGSTCTVGEYQPHRTQDGNMRLETVKLEDKSVCINSDSSLLPLNIKEEPRELNSEALTLPASDPPIQFGLEVKQEPAEFNISTQVPIPEKLEILKCDYTCGDCGQSFHSSSNLSKHMCIEDENFLCPVCDEEFAEMDQLLKHTCNSNLGDSVECNLHTCHICSMSFALRDTLNFHLTTHRNNSIPCWKEDRVPKQVQFELSPQISPALSTSSRTLSPTSSVSSRTLTASPCDVWLSDEEGSANLAKMKNLPKSKTSTPVVQSNFIPPPIPEHDYLGQVYKKNRPTATALVSSQKSPIFHEEKDSGVKIHSIASLVSSSHIQPRVLSRKQTRKVIRRMQLVCAESKMVKRLSK